MRIRRLITTLAAAATIAAPVAITTSGADAQPNGNAVAFGDSFVANPDQWKNMAKKIPAQSSQAYGWDYPHKSGCLQAPNNWPRLLAQQTGRRVDDWSCAGGTSWSLHHRIDQAIAAGHLNRGTRTVFISTGFNDFNPANIIRGNSSPFFGPNQEKYHQNLRIAANKIRRVAPNARLVIPGMLSISEPHGLKSVCLINVIPNAPIGLPLPHLQNMELAVRESQINAARAIGATFVDIKNQSAAHNTCARDAQRWVSGWIDTTTHDYNMAFHPSRAGSQFVANQVRPFL